MPAKLKVLHVTRIPGRADAIIAVRMMSGDISELDRCLYDERREESWNITEISYPSGSTWKADVESIGKEFLIGLIPKGKLLPSVGDILISGFRKGQKGYDRSDH